jgi:thiamine-monophosphate kinase
MSRFGTVIVGGDTTRSKEGITIDVIAIGEAIGGRYLRRRGAKAGDHIVITGDLGSSAAGLHALANGIDDAELVRAHMYPSPRILEGQWLCARPEVHAMLDISDGFCQDAGHLSKASRLGIDVYPERLPVAPALARFCAEHGLNPQPFMLTGGEDYELIFAVDAKSSEEILKAFHHEFRVETTVVGSVTDAWTGVRIHGEVPTTSGFDHFKTPT